MFSCKIYKPSKLFEYIFFAVCAKKVTQTPISESRLSIQIVLLGIYFIGSVLLSVGVFMKSLVIKTNYYVQLL